MAPSRGSLNNAAVRPILQIEDPPPSTLAAQIVDSLTKRKEHSKYQDQESFRQLLREILDVDDGHPDSIETNVEVNHKIIYVVVRSGIEVLFQDDPFNKKDDLTQQCLSSLAVIRLTIQRSPEVLFFTPEIHEPDPKLGGPLFLWLIPKLLSLLAWSGDFRIQEAALRALQTILEIERKTHCRGIMPQSVLKYIQGCVKGESST
jgi:serine/threonine-protein kinase ATR